MEDLCVSQLLAPTEQQFIPQLDSVPHLGTCLNQLSRWFSSYQANSLALRMMPKVPSLAKQHSRQLQEDKKVKSLSLIVSAVF